MNQKSQLGENIELIKLRRQNKQLESQLRVAEHSQMVLQQDVTRLQKENGNLHVMFQDLVRNSKIVLCTHHGFSIARIAEYR